MQPAVDLSDLLSIAQVGVRRASAFMALGLKVAADNEITSVQLDSNFRLQFMPEPLSVKQSAEVRDHFAKWIVANGLRELDQHFAAYADAIYPAFIVVGNGGKLPPDVDARAKVMSNDTNLGNKLRRLQNEFELKLSYVTHIASLSYARNAITHNLGRVAFRHCNEGMALKLQWRGMDLLVEGKAFSGAFEPFVVEEGGGVAVRFTDRTRTIQLGEVIDLSPHDLSEICLTFQQQAAEVHLGIVGYAKKMGIPVEVKGEPAAGTESTGGGQ